MNYYEVLISDARYQGKKALSYSFDQVLKVGQIVKVPFRDRLTLGVVINKINTPKIKVKQIEDKISNVVLPVKSLRLIDWLIGYYPAGLGSIVRLFVPSSLLLKNSVVKSASKISNIQKLPQLTGEQKNALRSIYKLMGKQSTVLLHGETATGKTRVYIELARRVLAKNKSVLVLTPEISLTPQLVDNFKQSFKSQVLVVHSSLTASERREIWLTILDSKEPLIVIGARSALFVPLENIGLIVVDEAHESSYKQDQAPYYSGLRVAGKLAQLHSSLLVLGTATPTVSEYFLAKNKSVPIIRLEQKAIKVSSLDKKVELISTRDRDNFSKHAYLSDSLLNHIQIALDGGNQSLVFLNRRGTARVVACQNCDWQALCPNCDLPLTYHGDSHLMRCHTCGYRTPTVSNCPKCGSSDIVFTSMGTKAIADSLLKIFPRSRLARFDTDNLQAERFEKHYQAALEGKIDILVGTQILAKGLDLPKLAVLGVLGAETSLSFPDYTAEERTYQLIRQVLGRIGRGHLGGHAVIQARNTKDPIITSAVNNDWAGFYKRQLEGRRKYLFPPYCYLLKLTCRRKSRDGAQKAAENLLNQLRQLPLKARIVGPAPSFYEKSRGQYEWQLIVKAKNRAELLNVVANLPSNWTYNLDPSNLL